MASFRCQINARLTCHAWEISTQLRKLANRFPCSKANILSYSDRLEAMSMNLLLLFPIMGSLHNKDLIIVRHHLGPCHRFLNTLHGLQELLALCAQKSTIRPEVLLSGNWVNLFGEDAHQCFQQALSNIDASINRAVYSMRESFKRSGDLCSELEVLFEWVATRLQISSIHAKAKDTTLPQQCSEFSYQEMVVQADAAFSGKERNSFSIRTHLTSLPGIRTLQIKPLTISPSSPALANYPDLQTLSWMNNNGEPEPLIPSSLSNDDITFDASFFGELLADEYHYQASFPESLIDYTWDKEAQSSAGRLMLHKTLLTSHNHGRPKEREVLLFQNRLLFLRNKGDFKMVIWDISLWKDVILIAYNPTGRLQRTENISMNSGSLIVYWKAEIADKPRVSGVQLYFEDLRSLQLWAAFLALDPKRPESVDTFNETASIEVSEASVVWTANQWADLSTLDYEKSKPANTSNETAPMNTPEAVLAQWEPDIQSSVSVLTESNVSASRQGATADKNGDFKRVWAAFSRTKKTTENPASKPEPRLQRFWATRR